METDDVIERLLHGGLPLEREAAARALDHAEQNADVERALVHAARHDSDPMVRKWSLHALACATCKPDGRCSTEVVSLFVKALLEDRSGKVRKFAAGMMMHGQLGFDERVTKAFRAVAHHPQRVVRERAAFYLARCS